MSTLLRSIFVLAAFAIGQSFAQAPANVLVVVNTKSALSRSIGEYYVLKRTIPLKNVCNLKTAQTEEIDRFGYENLESDIRSCLKNNQLVEQISYIVTTAGVPLRIQGSDGIGGEIAAVDSELALLYQDIKTGQSHKAAGMIPNPFFGKKDAAFNHANFPIYLVTRLAAYDFNGVRAIIDRGLQAKNRGKFVIDMSSNDNAEGNDWLRRAAALLPANRVIFDDTTKVLYNQTDVIGYAAWGSNDKNRHDRYTHFQWLPGAIATEFVSSNARTFARPPKDWNISDWTKASEPKWFAGSPQTMTADYLDEGASASTGHVYEPYLMATPRPELLLPAYFKGRNLAESFYLSIPYLSWQNVVIGDPLMSLGAPK
jgi:uncharacterized protein (TIGR03790 family)